LLRSVAAQVAACSLLVPLLVAGRADAREARAVDDARDVEDEEVLGGPGDLRTRADVVSFDARARTLELEGDVRMDAPPFHLRSNRIVVTRTRYGVELDGKGTLAFCPCLGTPLTVEFDHAIVAPPGDLILENPTARLYGVPFLYLPYFWLRADDKIGALPPDLAWRGQDGLFAGAGVHLPWRAGGERRALDLRAGAYVLRGFAADARLFTERSMTRVRYDRLPGAPAPRLPLASGGSADGLVVDARGATSSGEAALAWDVDAVRGRRGVVSTTDLDAAARPYDRASAEAAVSGGGVVASTGIRAVTRRGGGVLDVESAGPVAALRTSGALGAHVVYDATVEGGALRVSGTSASLAATELPSFAADTVSFARAELGARASAPLGPLASELSARGAADAAREGRASGTDRVGSVRARLALPLVRRFAPPASHPNDPLVHLVEPFAEAAVVHASGDALLSALPGRGASLADGTAQVALGGIATSLGRWGAREAIDLSLAGGAAPAAEDGAPLRTLARGRVAGSLPLLAASGDAAVVAGGRAAGEPDGAARAGAVVVGRVRVGPGDGVRVVSNVATRSGLDPALARLLADAPLEPAAGFLTREGTTGGAGLVVPWSRHLTTSAGADADLTEGELVAARAGVELRDRCGCVTLRLNGARRIGRSGVDVWLALDFAPAR
jgi:hypothetical protein